MRSLPAAWTSAASSASTDSAHDVRLLVRLEIDGSGTGLWLSQAAVAEDATGLGVWEMAGAWSAATEYGPYPLLRSVPGLSMLSDLEGMRAQVAAVSGLTCSNEKSAALLADLGVDRLSDLRLGGTYSFKDRAAKIVANYVGVAWASRVEWNLIVRDLGDFDERDIRFNCSEGLGVGSIYINSKIDVADHPYRPPENQNSPKPIVLGAGSVRCIPVREHVIVTDREGQAVSGGYVSPLNPATGAPWSSGDAVTYGSGTATTSSVSGTDDTDTQLNLNAPGLPRNSDHGETDLTTFEEGYHVVDVPASAVMDYVAADPDFTHSIDTSTLKMLPPGSRDLVALPPYCSPTAPGSGVVQLAKMPRSGGRIADLWLDGSGGSGVAASTVFTELVSGKLGLAYDIESGAGTLNMQGARDGWVSSLELLKAIDIQTRSRIFWDGEQVRLRKRQTATEIGSSYDWSVDRDDAIEGFPSIMELPVQYQLPGVTGRWALKPGRDADDAQSYAGQRLKGEGGNPRGGLWWLDLIRDDATGQEVIDFWYELLGPMSTGRWPRWISGLVLDWSYAAMEPEDIVRIERVDGDGDALDGLSAGNSVRWRVVSVEIQYPQGGQVGKVVADLLEVYS